MSVALLLVVPYNAVITTSVDALTGRVVSVTTALDAPPGIVRDGGVGTTAATLLDSATTAPPRGPMAQW